MRKIKELGQVFTDAAIVDEMLSLRQNQGRILEPSCGDGAFFNKIPNCVGIELDSEICPKGAICMDFFDYPLDEKFDTIIGNPPYVQHKYIGQETKSKLDMTLFNEKTNLYLFFIKKCVDHLNPNGELIFIVPRELQKATSATKLNHFLFDNGSFTYFRETGDDKIFKDACLNCVIFRYVKGDLSHKLDDGRIFNIVGGNIVFSKQIESGITLQDVATVKVGEVSGCDEIFVNNEYGNKEFVWSQTRVNGTTRRMIYELQIPYLNQFKDKLLSRKAKVYTEDNWWTWVRTNKIGNEPRVYVNNKTRVSKPFFTHPCNNFDGSVLGIFPKNTLIDLEEFKDMLNDIDWEKIGFKAGERYLFSQKSLSNAPLPNSFKKFLPKEKELSQLSFDF